MIVETNQRPAAAFSESLKIAIEKLKQGDAQGALLAASDACHAAPKEPQRTLYVWRVLAGSERPGAGGTGFCAGAATRRPPGSMPGSITASPAIGEATSKTPRRRCARRSFARRAIRRQAPISAPSCASPASRREARRCCGRPSRASLAMPGRGSTSSPISCRANAPPKRWRCLMMPRRRPAMCGRNGIGTCRFAGAASARTPGGGARRARCVRGARPVPA